MHRTSLFSTRSIALLAVAGLLFFAHAQPEVALPELDLETLEAETPEGTLQAERAENAFVAEIEDGRAIGIAFASAVDMPAEQDDIVVRLYDRQQAAVFVGPIDDQGNALLQSVEGSDFESTVAITVHDDAATGTVTFGNESPTSFTANAASGVAGVYWAFGDEETEILSVDWIVLPDGRQWGVICIPPTFQNPFCGVRSF